MSKINLKEINNLLARATETNSKKKQNFFMLEAFKKYIETGGTEFSVLILTGDDIPAVNENEDNYIPSGGMAINTDLNKLYVNANGYLYEADAWKTVSFTVEGADIDHIYPPTTGTIVSIAGTKFDESINISVTVDGEGITVSNVVTEVVSTSLITVTMDTEGTGSENTTIVITLSKEDYYVDIILTTTEVN